MADQFSELNVITSEMPMFKGCPALGRTRAFEVDQGVAATLQFQFTDKQGRPIDLTKINGFQMVPEISEEISEGVSEPGDPLPIQTGVISLKIREFAILDNPTCNPIYSAVGKVKDARRGIVRAVLPIQVYNLPGIYKLSWGITDATPMLVWVQNGLLSVERSLFIPTDGSIPISDGPVTLGEVRTAVMDGLTENMWLQETEYKDDQIIFAVGRPIRYFNEMPPRLSRLMDTRTFGFREQWLQATIGYLCEMAAHSYRRTNLPYSAGGVSINDRNKEKEYAAKAAELLQTYREFVRLKKSEINMRSMVGSVSSDYSRISRQGFGSF